MRRRAFLGRTAAAGAGAAALAALPRWLSRAFAQDPPDPLAALSQGYRQAQRAGKPLLVVIVPADGWHRHRRGVAFGELFNLAANETMALLALCEVVCAPIDALRRLVPHFTGTAGGRGGRGDAEIGPEPWMVLVETDAVPASVRALDGLPESPYEVSLGALVRDGVAPEGATLARRAAQARRRLDAAALARLDGALRAGTVTAALADPAAAIVARHAAGSAPGSPSRVRLEAILAAAAIARLRTRRIAGSRWSRSTACGVDHEDTAEAENGMMDCGMGHTSPRSARFLTFYARTP